MADLHKLQLNPISRPSLFSLAVFSGIQGDEEKVCFPPSSDVINTTESERDLCKNPAKYKQKKSGHLPNTGAMQHIFVVFVIRSKGS